MYFYISIIVKSLTPKLLPKFNLKQYGLDKNKLLFC
jgi:hypothetical protein